MARGLHEVITGGIACVALPKLVVLAQALPNPVTIGAAVVAGITCMVSPGIGVSRFVVGASGSKEERAEFGNIANVAHPGGVIGGFVGSGTCDAQSPAQAENCFLQGAATGKTVQDWLSLPFSMRPSSKVKIGGGDMYSVVVDHPIQTIGAVSGTVKALSKSKTPAEASRESAAKAGDVSEFDEARTCTFVDHLVTGN
jgi:hypothetical protein